MAEFNKRSEQFDNVKRDNSVPSGNEKGTNEFQVNRDNFTGSEFNTVKNKKKISTAVKVVTTIASVSLIAGGGVLMGKDANASKTPAVEVKNLNYSVGSRHVSYDIDIESSEPATIILKNRFTKRSFPLKNGTNKGIFEDLRPDTAYELTVVADKKYGINVIEEDIATDVTSDEDLYAFVDPGYNLKSYFDYTLYYGEQYNKENLFIDFVPFIGDGFTINAADSGVDTKVELANYNLLSSSGVLHMYYVEEGNTTSLIEKVVEFSYNATEIRSFACYGIDFKTNTAYFELDFDDFSNVWHEFHILLDGERSIKVREEDAYSFKIQFESEADFTRDIQCQIFVKPTDTKFDALYKIFDETINLKGDE